MEVHYDNIFMKLMKAKAVDSTVRFGYLSHGHMELRHGHWPWLSADQGYKIYITCSLMIYIARSDCSSLFPSGV